jgi:hypothetical protein
MMSGSEPINREAVVIYLDGAHEALRNAQYNLDGSFLLLKMLMGSLIAARPICLERAICDCGPLVSPADQ